MATRAYISGNRTFEITLSRVHERWTVEHVYSKSLNAEIQVPEMNSIVASTEDVAFAGACDCIDKFVGNEAKRAARCMLGNG